ncbi:MAG: hypothetical protein ACE144_19185 [Thermodesulfobacteriota bacterium]
MQNSECGLPNWKIEMEKPGTGEEDPSPIHRFPRSPADFHQTYPSGQAIAAMNQGGLAGSF